jgi:UDP-N-acetylmuramate--alanine ligase
LSLSVPGRHNLLNAAGALAAALVLGASPGDALEGLRTFAGVERRFSVRGEEDGVLVVDDYAHNPPKVSAAIDAAREAYPERRIVVLFQPHRYLRTLRMADAFGTAFDRADVVVVTDVFSSGEEPIPGVSGRIVSDAIRKHRGPDEIVFYIPRLEEGAGVVAGLAQQGDVVLTLGAGDITSAGPRILEFLANRNVPLS